MRLRLRYHTHHRRVRPSAISLDKRAGRSIHVERQERLCYIPLTDFWNGGVRSVVPHFPAWAIFLKRVITGSAMHTEFCDCLHHGLSIHPERDPSATIDRLEEHPASTLSSFACLFTMGVDLALLSPWINIQDAPASLQDCCDRPS
jgi:hypothetical protein